MDAAQWSQQLAILPRPMEETTTINSPINNLSNTIVASKQQQQQQQQQQQALERKTRPQKEQNLNCPRCNSTNTKFCYYNNYSLTQPRYFCKTCRRYWTKGGSLRSVPVGGGSRKNKRSSNSSILTSLPPPPPQLQSPSTTTTQSPMLNKLLVPDLNPPTSLSHLLNSSHQNPNNNIKFLEAHDLNLAFPIQGLFNHHIDHQFPKMEGNNNNNNNNENHEPSFNLNPNNSCPTITTTATTTTTTATTTAPISALELLRTGMASRGSLNPFSPMSISSDPSTLYQSGYPNLQDFKPNMMNIFASPNDHINNNNSNDNNNVGGGARLLFPFADHMNKLATNTTHTHNHHIDENDDQSKGNGDDDHHHHHLNHHSSGFWNGMLGGGTW